MERFAQRLSHSWDDEEFLQAIPGDSEIMLPFILTMTHNLSKKIGIFLNITIY